MSIMQDPMAPTVAPFPQKKGGGCFAKGCGCFLIIILIFAALIGGGSYYAYNWLTHVTPDDFNKVVDVAYMQYFRPEFEKVLDKQSIDPQAKQVFLSKADKAVAAYKKEPMEVKIALLGELVTFVSDQSSQKITPPDQIPHLAKFISDNNLMDYGD